MRILHIIISTLFIVLLLGCASKSDPTTPGDTSTSQVNLYPAQVGMAFGYIDTSGKMVIPAKFTNAGLFKEGLAPVENASLGGPISWGYINTKGSYVIKPQFYKAEPFSDGMGKVTKYINGDYWFGYVDNKGKLVIKPQFKDARNFYEGVAWVRSAETDRWGLIDKTGTFITKANLENAVDFFEGLASVKIKNGYGFVDTKGKLVIQPQYTFAYKFSEGMAYVNVGDREYGKYGYIDKNGKMVIKPEYYAAGDFSEGLAPVKLRNSDKGPWAYIDKKGQIAIKPFEIGYAGSFSTYGLAPINTISMTNEGSYGFIDRTGKVIIKPQYYSVGEFLDGGVCQVHIDGRHMAYIDKTGKTIWKSDEIASPEEMLKSSTTPGGAGAMPMPEFPPMFFLFAFILGVIINSFILNYAANYIGIADVTYGKCLLAAFCGTVLNTLVGAFFKNSGMSFGPIILSFFLAAVITTTMIKYILNTEWGRAVVTYVAMLVIEIIIAFGLVFCLAGGACCLIPGRF